MCSEFGRMGQPVCTNPAHISTSHWRVQSSNWVLSTLRHEQTEEWSYNVFVWDDEFSQARTTMLPSTTYLCSVVYQKAFSDTDFLRRIEFFDDYNFYASRFSSTNSTRTYDTESSDKIEEHETYSKQWNYLVWNFRQRGAEAVWPFQWSCIVRLLHRNA